MPRPKFTLRALLLAMLVVAAFLGGMRVERERIRREEEAAALAANNAKRAAALARAAQRTAALADEMHFQRQQIAAEQEARQRINRNLFLQQQKVDQLMARYKALMDEERRRDQETDENIRKSLKNAAE